MTKGLNITLTDEDVLPIDVLIFKGIRIGAFHDANTNVTTISSIYDGTTEQQINDNFATWKQEYLDSQPTPIIIVETGCLRVKDNFLDGQSTLLFDKYTLSRGENSKVFTVDVNKESTENCKKVVSDNVEITTDDSVRYLNNLTSNFLENKTKVLPFKSSDRFLMKLFLCS